MSVTWTITAGATTKTLEAWGISDARLVFRNLDVDELSFRIVRADVFADPVFTYDQELILSANGVRRFVGRVGKLPAEGSSRSEGERYVVFGPWWQLSRLVYQQPRKVKNEDFTEFDTEDTTRVILGQSEVGARITTGAQIAQILTYALTQGAPIAAGSMPAFVTAPLDECRDITCAEAIRRQMAYTPDAVSWFDYSGGVPLLNVQRRDLLSAEEIAIDAADLVQEFSLTPRNDLVPPGVVFIYVTTETHEEKTYTRITRDTAGLTTGIGVITATIEMMGAGTENQEAPPIGLALEYFAALQVLPWEGALTLKERDCSGTVRPGKVLNFTGGRAAWATMRAVVQIVSEELQSGVTTIELGPPEHLAPQDFVNQIMFNRKAARPPEPTNLATTKPEETPDGDPNENAGEDPKSYTGAQTASGGSRPLGQMTLTVCEDGEESEITVFTPP